MAPIGPVTLTSFVDFVAANGTSRITKVTEIKHRPDYDVASDFYRPLRKSIVAVHQEGRELSDLEDLLPTLTDARKQSNYPPLIAAYQKALSMDWTWFEPPRSEWSHAGLSVTVNPELGLVIKGIPHIIKLYFKQAPLVPQRNNAILELLSEAFGKRDAAAKMAVLDVRNGKLLTPRTRTRRGTDLFLQSEAAAFVEIWRQV